VGINEHPDLGVIAYYGKIIKQNELDIPKNGFINIHPSLLPKYRGPSPVRTALLNGDAVTGLTIHITVAKVDAGPILTQREFLIDPNDNYEILEEKLFELGAQMLPDTIEDWVSGKIIPEKQNEPGATYTKIVKTEDGHIDWFRSPQEIISQIRAYSPNPGTYTRFNGKRLLILSGTIEIRLHDLKPGTVEKRNFSLVIASRGGFFIPHLIKLEGKKEVTPEAFSNGHKDIIGTILD
jgi:methionyl-tRNA formyltransferase